MNYTVSDFYRPLAGKLKLLAGAGGMARPIDDAGILDYEMVPELKNKYVNTNFHPNQLVVTTFLYTRDNPYQITDAIRHLIVKGTSCLVIKNIFHLPIHEAALRYADSKNYPVFVTEARDVYVEAIIYSVKNYCRSMKDIHYAADLTELICSSDMSGKKIRETAKQICPSFSEQFFCVSIRFDDTFSEEAFAECETSFQRSSFHAPGRAVIYQREGLLAVISDEYITPLCDEDYTQSLIEKLCNGISHQGAGVSSTHLSLGEFRQAVEEARDAAAMARPGAAVWYSDLGIFRMLLPFAGSPAMDAYAQEILGPISDHDIENNGQVLRTLRAFIDCNANIPETAARLKQHVNTIRYRLDRIRDINGLDYKDHSDLQQLSMAVKIQQAAELRRG